jgi:exodeoxyribonuclease V gamma subunit
VAQALRAEMAPVLAAWAGWQARHAEPAEPAPVGVDLQPPGLATPLRVEAGLLPWRLDEQGHAQLLRVSAGRVTAGKAQRKPRPDQLVGPWLDQLALGASGRPCGLQVIGPDGIVHAAPVAEAEARGLLSTLAAACCEGTGEGGPWPTALATGLAWLPGRDAHAARAAYDSASQRRGDDQEPHLARLYPRFADLLADPRFESATEGLYAPLAAWLATLRVEPLPDAVALADPDAEAADD